MNELRFDDRVAIVTGAGGNPSLGRAYARLLAARGAKVVVNDLGTGPDGQSKRRAAALDVVHEIREAGGEAIADRNSVADETGAERIVATALAEWGRVDILINNAGMLVLKRFEEIRSDELRAIVDVHLMGTIWMCRAVWAHMREQQYGRIVNISGRVILGDRHTPAYDAAKAGVVAFARTLAIEGEEHGIKVNTLIPRAGTGATLHFNQDSEWLKGVMDERSPELVAPAAALLSHESCAFSGKCLWASGGHVSEYFTSETRGFTDPELTPESLAENIELATDRTDAIQIGDPVEENRERLQFVPKVET